MTWRTHEEIDEYWEREETRIKDAYVDGRIRRATMMGALKKLAQDVTVMHDKLDEPEEDRNVAAD